MNTLKHLTLTFKVVTVSEVPAKHEYIGSKGTQFSKKNSLFKCFNIKDKTLQLRYPPFMHL